MTSSVLCPEELGRRQENQADCKAGGDQDQPYSVRELIEQRSVNQLTGRLSAHGEGEHVRHDFAHQMIGRSSLYDGNGVRGEQAASQLAGAEHNKKDQIAGKGMKGE